jgi:hypothetical protein
MLAGKWPEDGSACSCRPRSRDAGWLYVSWLAKSIASTSKLSSEVLFDLLPFPLPVQERNLVEHAQSVKQQADTPAKRGPDHPEILLRRNKVHDDEEADNDAVLRKVNVESSQLADVR